MTTRNRFEKALFTGTVLAVINLWGLWASVAPADVSASCQYGCALMSRRPGLWDPSGLATLYPGVSRRTRWVRPRDRSTPQPSTAPPFPALTPPSLYLPHDITVRVSTHSLTHTQ